MRKISILIAIFPMLLQAQTFTRKDGDVVGYQTVMSMPKAPGVMIQGLVYYPDDYFLPKNANKKYPVYVFLHGAGEAADPKSPNVHDINYMNKAGLPLWLSKGNKPYGIDPKTGDTIKWIIVSPHCTDNTGCSYSYPQLQYTLPYVFPKLRIDSSCIWVGGLSGGGSGTWQCVMANRKFGSLFAGIMPESNGGWEEFIKVDSLKQNLIQACKNGLATLYIIGDQDQGWNDIGGKLYYNIDSTNSQPGKFYFYLAKGLTHVPAVWDQPWPLTARVWSKTMNSWSQMWTLRKGSAAPPVVTPPVPVSVPRAVITIDSSVINYPNSVVQVSGSSSYATNGKIATNDWYQTSGGNPAIFTSCTNGYVCVSGLRPGKYQFKLLVTDSVGYQDSALVNVTVNPPPPCPVCSVCPAQRTVTKVELNAGGIWIAWPFGALRITYSDGTTQ